MASTESLHIFILSPAILIGQRLRTVSKAIKKAANRPDIVARVFQLKLKELIKDIQKNQILGVVGARIHVIEFQKRGLPHVHMLIWIHPSDVPKKEEEYVIAFPSEELEISLQSVALVKLDAGAQFTSLKTSTKYSRFENQFLLSSSISFDCMIKLNNAKYKSLNVIALGPGICYHIIRTITITDGFYL